MQTCSCLLFSCLLSIILLHCSVHSFSVQRQPGQHIDQSTQRSLMFHQHRPEAMKVREELTAKLLRLDDLVRMENDVMEPKRKRSFPGNNSPLDRLSVSSMETKQGSNKQSKVVELPRRRFNPPPIDRIGMSRLPNNRG
ncbi:osteocrin-like [Parambassis ranga]|uniref:Osteocrin-like n=1 Tax=Parambassis ranga TaxID=210632 RepID=A0A6P7JFW3_9TELE|nr:osteocrin-like [Parambassis ranga]